MIYLPFLVIDLVVSNVLLALGMQMMTPTQVSLPFKLLLFVAIDGWGLISQALVTGYHLSNDHCLVLIRTVEAITRPLLPPTLKLGAILSSLPSR